MDYPQQRELLPGEMLGAFRIERTLGTGGFGITYLATDTSLGECFVAIKEYFPPNAWRDTDSRLIRFHVGDAERAYQVGLQHFHREGQILAKFKHPNIVRARQMFTANNTAYLVMDYEEGEELERYLHTLKRPLTHEEAESIFNPVLDGLRAVHEQGLLHLDIKPENIFLRKDSTPILIDFGGARHQLGKESVAVSFLVASEGYAPNEQYSGHKLQATTDIYAVAATLYRSIAGKTPVDAKVRAVSLIDKTPDPLISSRQLFKQGQYPSHFLRAIDDALSMCIAERPQSVRELQQRLFTKPKSEFNTKLLGLVGGFAVLGLMVVGWALWTPQPSPEPLPLITPNLGGKVIAETVPPSKPNTTIPNEPPKSPPAPAKKPASPAELCRSNSKSCGGVAETY